MPSFSLQSLCLWCYCCHIVGVSSVRRTFTVAQCHINRCDKVSNINNGLSRAFQGLCRIRLRGGWVFVCSLLLIWRAFAACDGVPGARCTCELINSLDMWLVNTGLYWVVIIRHVHALLCHPLLSVPCSPLGHSVRSRTFPSHAGHPLKGRLPVVSTSTYILGAFIAIWGEIT